MGLLYSTAIGDGYTASLEDYNLTGLEKLPSGTYYNRVTNTWYGRTIGPRYHHSVSAGEVLIASCDRTPNKLAQISDNNDQGLTYHELKLKSVRICENLRKIGYQKGDMVMIIARNGHNLAPVIFGCLLLGAPFNPMDPSFLKDDLAHMIAITKPKLVFCDAQQIAVVQMALLETLVQAEIITFEHKLDGMTSVEELMSATVEDEEFYRPLSLGDVSKHPAAILCSSGTTGRSKAVVVSHTLLLAKSFNLVSTVESDIMVCFSSIYWLSGLLIMMHGTINNATRVITNEVVTPDLVLRILSQYKVTIIFTPPDLLSNIVHSLCLPTTDLSCLKTWLCGGSMVSTALQEKIQPHLPYGQIVVCYGMTEVSGLIALNYPKARSASVGALTGGVEAKIVDDYGYQIGPNKSGEIMIRSLYYFLGYLDNYTASREVVEYDHWLHTGDTGYFDNDGFLFISGRKKEIIKYCHYQISPDEIAVTLEKFDEVQSAFVTGMFDDDDKGDVIVALVVAAIGSTATEGEILERYNATAIDYKKLRGGVFFVDTLPMTVSGKVMTKEAKQLAIHLFEERKGLISVVSLH